MDEEQKKLTVGRAYGELMQFEQLYDLAFQDGRESLLRAAQELFKGSPAPTEARDGCKSTLDQNDDLEAHRGQQSLKSLRTLRDWVALDPKHNRYDVGESDLVLESKKYRVTVWRASRFPNDVNYHNFYGYSDLDALADAAQSVMAEVEEARNAK